MRTILLSIFLLSAIAASITPAIAGDNDDTDINKQMAESEKLERDPFQLPQSVKRRGLAAAVNNTPINSPHSLSAIEPAAGK